MTNKKHNYDWNEMDFDPDGDGIVDSFYWDKTPQGEPWWAANQYTPEGKAEFARMKRLYAEDMGTKEGPVRTVTKKEIVPGVYGAVSVSEIRNQSNGRVVCIGIGSWLTPDELTDTIETLTQIRDALKDNE